MHVSNEKQAGGEAIIVEGRKFPQYLAAFFVTLSATSVGTFLAWTSPTFPLIKEEGVITDDERAWASSILSIGAFFGALPAGFLVNNLGRKFSLLLMGIPMTVSWGLISFTNSAFGLILGRGLGGLSLGVISVAASLYISEMAENSVRGTLGTFFQLQITIGILYTYIIGLAENVKEISLLCAIIPFLFMACFVWMPESPVYLLGRGREEEARESLTWFRGQHYQTETELSNMKLALQESQRNQAGLKDALSDRITRKALIISLGLMVFQQLSGVNAVVFYSGQIFKSAGSKLSSTLAAIIIGTVQVFATYCSTLLIEKKGRKCLLLISDSFMAICLFVLGAYFRCQESNLDVSAWNWVPLVSLSVFIVVFSLGFGPIPWIIMGELFPSNLKGISSALAAGSSWILSFFVTKYFETLVQAFGQGITFWIFGMICSIGTLFVVLLLPETKGKDIDTILEELGGKKQGIQLETAKS